MDFEDNQVGADECSTMPRTRKVRKGTRSCWECKGRKTRCIFLSPIDTICIGCKSRGIKCIGQGFHEELSTPRTMTTKRRRKLGPERQQNNYPRPTRSLPTRGSTEATVSPNPYAELHQALSEVWPSDRHLDLIRGAAARNSYLLRGPLYSPYSNLAYQDELILQDILQPPPIGLHPVLFARKLLLLGVILHQIPCHVPDCHDVASRILDAVVGLVTSNDNFVQSIEGIECIALESMFHNNRGNLHRALLSLRKALVLAQLMGLHRQAHPSSLSVLDLETKTRIDFNYVWYRLVESDRYLSLMLGVPQAWGHNDFLERKPLELCSQTERLERLLLIVGGRILERNQRDVQNITTTQEIDQLLQRASTCMPPQWWLVPNCSASSGDSDTLETSRLMLQFTHLFLLTQTHFPYLLCSSDNHAYTYSKITALNAGRDILARYTAFRSSEETTSYCRGIDFIAFFASAALCLAYIVGSRGRCPFPDEDDESKAFYYLTHQRFSDRGLVEKASEHLEKTINENGDAIASKLVNSLRPLLAMEASSSIGAIFSAEFSAEGDCEDPGCSTQVGDSGSVLQISIPHCGSVRVESQTVDDEPLLSLDSIVNLESIDPTWLSETFPGDAFDPKT